METGNESKTPGGFNHDIHKSNDAAPHNPKKVSDKTKLDKDEKDSFLKWLDKLGVAHLTLQKSATQMLVGRQTTICFFVYKPRLSGRVILLRGNHPSFGDCPSNRVLEAKEVAPGWWGVVARLPFGATYNWHWIKRRSRDRKIVSEEDGQRLGYAYFKHHAIVCTWNDCVVMLKHFFDQIVIDPEDIDAGLSTNFQEEVRDSISSQMNKKGNQEQAKERIDRHAIAGSADKLGRSSEPGAGSNKQRPTRMKRMMQAVLQRITEGNDQDEPRQERAKLPSAGGHPSNRAPDRPNKQAQPITSTRGQFPSVVRQVLRLKTQAERKQRVASNEMPEEPTVSLDIKNEPLTAPDGKEDSMKRTCTDIPIPTKNRRQSTKLESHVERERPAATNQTVETPKVSYKSKNEQVAATGKERSTHASKRTETDIPARANTEGHMDRKEPAATNEMVEKSTGSLKSDTQLAAAVGKEGSAHIRKRSATDIHGQKSDWRQSKKTENAIEKQ